jgi:hypothetical protein
MQLPYWIAGVPPAVFLGPSAKGDLLDQLGLVSLKHSIKGKKQ